MDAVDHVDADVSGYQALERAKCVRSFGAGGREDDAGSIR
jgi:hypothetical protein